MKKYDVIVIGAGSGLTISSAAAEVGKKVAIVEEGPFGGTCLNRGCIPSKMLIHSSDVMQTIKQSELFGIKTKVLGVDFKKIVTRVNKIVDGDAKAIEKAGMELKQTLIRGGTDGARLSARGIPTPNLFAGGLLFHSLKEYIPIPALQKSAEVLLYLAQNWKK